MTAASAVSAAVARLEYLMRDEEDIMQLRKELAELVTYLEACNSLISMGLEKEVTQLAYDIEDSIESHVREWDIAGKPRRSLRKFFPWSSLKDDLNIFRRKIKEVKRQMGNYSPDEIRSPGAAEILGTKKSSKMSATHVVALSEDVEMLLSRLVEGEDHLSVVVIFGMGGTGKTTLARSLFDHPSVKKHFDFRYWAHAGVDFQARGILEYILSDVYSDGRRKKIEEMESMELMKGIYEACKGKRYLVVLDDVRSSEDWETIRFAFPDDNNGSRIIVTSRLKDVAHRSPNYTYDMRPLTLEQSWELMKTQLGHQDLDVEAQEIGLQIIKHCPGVPLVIILLSSQLRFRQLEDWKELLQQMEQNQYKNEYEIFLYCIYNLLPVHLKPCFLYLGHFPTNHEIPIEKLYLLWIAEGFVSPKGVSNISKFDMAENYLKALVDRRMVMIQEEEVIDTRRSKSCQIHDKLRDLCVQKGMDEEFLLVVDFGCANSKRFVSHRLAIYLNMHESADGVSLDIPEARSIRSLLFFETNGVVLTKPNSRWPVEVADLKEFRWARVLDFDGVDFRVKQLPKNIKRLVYLRYLSFRECYLLEFPSSFSNLSFLETLDLLVRESCRITISNVLWNFKRLRYLYLPVVFQTDSKARDHKLKLNGLAELEILQNFHAGLCDANDLEMLENVKSFTGVVDGNNDDLVKIIGRLKHWNLNCSQTSLVVKNFDSYSEKRFSIVKDLLTSYMALCVLEIEGHLPWLPSYTEISPNFTEMVFSGSELTEDPMQILGKLPKLRTLVLSNNAFAGYEMVCSKSDFPQLTNLKLAMLQRLREWKVNSGAMPNLALLIVEKCKCLQTLPGEVMKITTLQELKIGSMPQKFQQKVCSTAETLRVHPKVHVSAY